MRNTSRALIALFVFVSAASALHGQQPAGPPGAPAPGALRPGEEPKLVFDREVFTYSGERRRDPFTKLTGKAGAGPRFEDLSVNGIIFAGQQSVVLLADKTAKKSYRKHVGEIVGNSQIVQIQPDHVVFAVETFGQKRMETIEYKRRQGAT